MGANGSIRAKRRFKGFKGFRGFKGFKGFKRCNRLLGRERVERVLCRRQVNQRQARALPVERIT